MPALNTYQSRKFGVGSVVTLAKFGGAVLGGIWIQSHGATAKVAVYDGGSSPLATALAIGSTSVGVIGNFMSKDIEFGKGLTVYTSSCAGTIFWRPGAAGGV